MRMVCFRFSDPPKEIAEEQNRLIREYFDQYDDDDEIPDDEPEKYVRANASPALLAYMDEIRRTREEAERDGELI